MGIYFKTSHVIVYPTHFRAFYSLPYIFPPIFSTLLHFLPANALIPNLPTYHPINLLIFQAFPAFSYFFRLVKNSIIYIIKLSPVASPPFPKISSPNTLLFINLIIQIKSSSLSIT